MNWREIASNGYPKPIMPGFYHLFARTAEQYPSHIALEMQRANSLESHSYAETARLAECIGNWITQRIAVGTMPAGSRCAILAENQPRWVLAYLGILAAGCTVIPLDTAFRADQVAKLLKDSGASLVFTDLRHLPAAQAALATLEPSTCSIALLHGSVPDDGTVGNLDAMFSTGTQEFRPVDVSPDLVASLGYTSGTTSDPKGVMLTHRNLAAEGTAVFSLINVQPTDALLGVLPLFHVLAQMANLLLPLLRGARVVYLETLNTTELMRALRERNITLFVCVPQFFYLIHERIFREVTNKGQITKALFQTMMKLNRFTRSMGLNLGKLFFAPVHKLLGVRMRYFVTGGSRFDLSIAQDFHTLGFDILQAYGLTETSGCSTATPPKDNVLGSVGKPLQGFEVKIVGGEPSEDNGLTIGEVAIRGGHIMKGYWNRPDANAEVFKEGNGWFYSGDLGYLDAQGNLFITGRRKEVIVLSNGKNLFPEEIESYYLRSPAIKELCVMGLTDPRDPTLERLHAVIVPDFDVLRERKVVNSRAVIRFDVESISAQVPSTKRIQSYEIWNEELPRTTTKKLRRFEIEKRVKATQASGGATPENADPVAPAALSDDDALWLAQPAVERGLKVVEQAAKVKPPQILPRHNLELDLGLDSMQRIELMVAVEQELGGHVEESRIAELFTVRDLLDAVIASSTGAPADASRAQFTGWDSVLNDDPTEPEVLALRENRYFQRFLWYCLFRLVYAIFLVLFRIRVRGLENLPRGTTFILSPNHQSYLDPVGMVCRLPWRVAKDTFAVGTSDIFGMGIMQSLGRSMRVIAVDPDAKLVPAMRAGAFGLRNGRNLILYPEGERSIDGAPKLFKKGAAILSIHTQKPIVPIALEGFWESWPRNVGFAKFAPLRVVFGKPVYPPKLEELPADPAALDAEYAKLIAEVKQAIVEMWVPLNEESKARWAKQG